MLNKTKIDQIPILNFSKFLDGDEQAKVALASDLKWIQEKIGFYYIILISDHSRWGPFAKSLFFEFRLDFCYVLQEFVFRPVRFSIRGVAKSTIVSCCNVAKKIPPTLSLIRGKVDLCFY